MIPKHNGKNSPSVQSSNQEAYQTNIGRESLYDNENNSFIDAQDGNPLVFENAQVKLEMLAIQLGESCLT